MRRAWAHPRFDAVALGLLVVVIAVLNQVWVSIETRPPHWDMARHLGDSLVYLNSFSIDHPLRWLETYLYYPPFTYWVTDGFYAVLGTSIPVAVLSNVVFLAVLAFSTYAIGKLLWNRRVGLLATVFVLTVPVMVTNFKEYMLDAPLTALVTLALYLLIRSESFSRLRPSLLFGVVCGLGLLTKWTFPVFLALPLVVAGFVAIQRALRDRSADPFVHIAAAAVIAFAICGLWYLHNLGQLRHDLTYYGTTAGVIKGSPPVLSMASLSWYFWVLLRDQLWLIPFLLFVVGLLFAFRRGDAARRNLQPLLLIVGTYVISTAFRNKDVRYTLPMLPAVALVATSWLEYLAPRARRLASGAIVAYGAVVFLAISFGTSLLPSRLAIGKPINGKPGITLFAQVGYGIGPPTHEHWYQQEVFKQIADSGGTRTFVYTGPDSIWFNTWGIRYYNLSYHETWVASPQQANYLVVRTPPTPSAIPPGFGQLRSWHLPDGGTLTLYKRFLS